MSLKTKSNYLANPKLKKVGVKIDFTSDQVQEILKCSKDPLYFIRNYVKIVNLNEGLIKMNPYPYQEQLIEKFNNNRFILSLISRQSGKCCDINTLVCLRNKKTGAILKLTMGDLNEKLRNNKM